MKKQLLKIAFLPVIIFLVNLNAKAQTFSIGNDTAVCPGSQLTLNATMNGIQPSGGITLLNLGDDQYTGVINLGFTFNFYGTNYTQCLLSTNDYITFDLSNASGYSPWSINGPIPGNNPVNSVYGPDEDLYPPAGGVMKYGTCGAPPYQVFIYDFTNMPMFSCNAILFSGQILLYETTNVIEVHITSKNLCGTWNGGAAIEGIQNSLGILAEWVPGRNYPTNWTAANDAWRFTPNGANAYTVASIPYNPIPVGAAGGITWFDANGNVLGNGTSVSVTPNTNTFYSATYFTCTNSYSDTINVNVTPLTLQTSYQSSTCYNLNDGFCTAVGNANGPFNYVWHDSTGAIVQTHNNVAGLDSLTGLNHGGYYVVATNAIGCSAQSNFQLATNVFNADFTISNNPICSDKGVTFTNASIGNPVTYAWDFGDGLNNGSILPDPVYYFQDTGIFTVTQIITLSGGCTDTATKTVQVWPNNHVNYTVTPTIACVGRSITFKDASTTYPLSWNWLTSDFDSSSTNIMVHKFDSAGTYSIRLIVADSLCGTDTLTQFMNVFDYPIADIGKDTSICVGSQVVLDCGVPGMKYLWTTDATTQSITVAPTKETKYGVTLDNHGCIFTDDITIGIQCELYVPNAFSPNKDGYNDIFVPFGSAVTGYNMRVYDRWGEMVFETSSGEKLDKGWDGMFKADLAPMGVYTYVIKATFINNLSKEYKGNVTLLR